MQDTWAIVFSVLGVFSLMALGGLCRTLGWLTRSADHSLAKLCAFIFLPSYFIDRIVSDPEFDSLAVAWAPPLVGFTLTAIGFAMGWAFARSIGTYVGLDTDAKQRAFALCVGICNYGYIPFPIAEQFYPNVITEMILHNVGVDLALWSVGIVILNGISGGGWKRAIASPPLIAVLVAIALRFSNSPTFFPASLFVAIGRVGSCAIPMGLILGGAIIVDFLRESNWDRSLGVVLSAVGIRQLIMPILMLATASLVVPTVELRQVLMMQAAMPAATFPIVITRLYEKDIQTALRVVLSTSIAGLILIPAWLAIGKWWLS